MRSSRASLPLLFSVVFMDMVSFGFIIPLVPDYVRQFGGAPALAGVLTAAYALGQFFAAPVLGRLSDRHGRKPLLLASIGGTFLALLALGSAKSLALVFASRVLDGITGGNVTIAQSYIVDATDEKGRARGLGLIGMAFGLGFIFGPFFGGLLSRYGLSVPAFAAAGIAAINLALIAFVLPESLGEERRASLASGPSRSFSLGALLGILRRRGTGAVLGINLLYSFSFILFESMFAIFAAEALGLGPRERGWILAYIGVLSAVVQGALVAPLARRFDERKLAVGSVALVALSLGLYALSPSAPFLLVALAPLSLGAGVAGTLLRTLLTKSVPREEAGGTLGLAASAESLNRVLAPLAGAGLLALLGPRAPGFAAALAALAAALLGGRRLIVEDCLAKDGPSCSDPS